MEQLGFIQSVFNKYIWNTQKRNFTNLKEWGFIVDPNGYENPSGEKVTVRRGARETVAFSCINVLAQGISTLPFNVRRDTDNGKEVVKSGIYNLIHTRPNKFTTASNFWYDVVTCILTYGNSYSLIVKDGNGQAKELYKIDPDECYEKVYDGDLFYEHKGVLYPSEDILHFKLYSFDGIRGVSPIVWNAKQFGYLIKQERYKAKVLGSKPPGVITFTQQLTDEQNKQNRQMWNSMTQGGELGGTPVLSGGAKYQPFMVSPADGQLEEMSKFTKDEICSIFRVPPVFVQRYDNATYSKVTEQNLIFIQHTLTPIMRVIEQECDYKLFSFRNRTAEKPLYTKFNIKALLRGDIETQTEFYRTMRTLGVMTADEIRDLEDMPHLDGEVGSIPFIQAGMMPADQAREFYSSKSPGQEQNPDERSLGYKIELKEELKKRLEILNENEG